MLAVKNVALLCAHNHAQDRSFFHNLPFGIRRNLARDSPNIHEKHLRSNVAARNCHVQRNRCAPIWNNSSLSRILAFEFGVTLYVNQKRLSLWKFDSSRAGKWANCFKRMLVEKRPREINGMILYKVHILPPVVS